MKKSEYGKESIRDRDIMLVIPGMSIAIGVLYLPRRIAEHTIGLDGLLSITVGFLFTLAFTVMIMKVATNFPNTSFMEYAPKLVTKPIAILFSVLFGIHGLLLTAFEVRGISEIAHLHLFVKTPLVFIALAFFLVVIYGVSGSRISLLRLNELFLPFSVFIALFVALLSIGMTNKNNMLPIMQTDGNGFLHSFLIGSIALTGFGVLGYLLFYGSLIKKPEKPVRKAMMGVGLLYFIHLIFYLACIVVFGVQVTSNLMFPVIDLARAVEIPGGFFTRFESLFFVIWIMTIFITSIISFDMAIMGFQSIFKNASRMRMIFALSPIIFLLAGIPESLPETGEFGRVVSYYGFGLTIIATVLFFFILKIKGVKKNG